MSASLQSRHAISPWLCGVVAGAAALAVLASGCSKRSELSEPPVEKAQDGELEVGGVVEDARVAERHAMVDGQIARRGVRDPGVLAAMRAVRRHRFVPEAVSPSAYEDRPLRIGLGQTISQPYIVAAMTEALEVERGHRVLEIGTGSGYQAAVLAELVDALYTIERHCPLAERALATLKAEGYTQVEVRCGDGYAGWPEAAPFDRIMVTAAPPEVPPALVEQLAPGGRMVIPVGTDRQELRLITRGDDGAIGDTALLRVRFVPMVPD